MKHETAALIVELGEVITKIGKSLMEEMEPTIIEHVVTEKPGLVSTGANNQDITITESETAAGVEETESHASTELDLSADAIESALNQDPDFFDARLSSRAVWGAQTVSENADELREVCKRVIVNILAIAGQDEGGRCVTRSLWRLRATRLSEIPDHLIAEAARSLIYGCNECRALRNLAGVEHGKT